MYKTVSKPLAHLNFLSSVNCYDIGSKYDRDIFVLTCRHKTQLQRLVSCDCVVICDL
jgi:hypothetical protein